MSDDYSDTPRTNKLMNSMPFEQIARQFEREVASRDRTIASLQAEVEQLKREAKNLRLTYLPRLQDGT